MVDMPPYVFYAIATGVTFCIIGGMITMNFLRKLRESEERYRLLADNTLDVIWKLDFNLKFTYSNSAIFNMVGFTPEEWVGSRLIDHCSPEEMQKMQRILVGETKHQENHGGVVFETIFFHKNGGDVPCEVRAKILFDENGMPTDMQGTTREITDRKIAENKLNDTLTDLKRSNTDLEQFAYIASHDMKAPLQAIHGYLEVIKRRCDGKLCPDEYQFIDLALDGANRMHTLIDDLLMYSRIGNNEIVLDYIDVEEVLDNALANLKSSIDDSGATITHDEMPTIITDSVQMVNVFQNLIGNAIKFRDGEVPRIHIGAVKRGKCWTFSVKDNGIGIEKEFLDRVFIVFQRLHGDGEYSGTGIGLSICKKIVERHGGRIWVESEPGKGSTFYFTICMHSKL